MSKPPASVSHSLEDDLKLIDISTGSITDFEKELQSFAQLAQVPQIFPPSGQEPKAKSPQKNGRRSGVIPPKEEIRPFPKISDRSRRLAEKANERFFARYDIRPVAKPSPVKKTEKSIDSKPLIDPKPLIDLKLLSDPQAVVSPTAEAPSEDPPARTETVETKEDSPPLLRQSIRERIQAYLSTPDEPPVRPRPPSIFERGQLWLEQRSEKIRSKASQSPCTFFPVIYTKIPHHLHKLPSENLLQLATQAKVSSRTTPISAEGKQSPVRTFSASAERRSFSPAIRKLSSDSGCDWSSFVQRRTDLA